ncbi:MAG: ATP-binding cassette domain-containing protein [Oscillospiraceae bacterium]
MIEVKNLCKSFDTLEVLKNINLTIKTGEIYGLVGRSGAGKSTLLRCINGLENYNSGSLKIDNTEVKDLSKQELQEMRKGIGMIFQHFSLVERRTVFQNVALPMVCWKYDKNLIDTRVKELLEIVDIADKINERPSVLSGGQKQRVAIARALALDSHILLCDEATSALDPKTTRSVLTLLRDINKKLGLTIIVVTHQMEVVREVCDTISILENGKIAACGEVKDIFLKKPDSLMTLLGKEKNNYSDEKNVITFLLSKSQLNLIPLICNEYNAKILATNTNDYKGEEFTEVTISVDKVHLQLLTKLFENEKLLWNLEKGE